MTSEDVKNLILELRRGTIDEINEKMDNVVHSVNSVINRIYDIENRVDDLSERVNKDLIAHEAIKQMNTTLKEIHSKEEEVAQNHLENQLSEIKEALKKIGSGSKELSSNKATAQELFQNKYFWFSILAIIFFLGAGSGAVEAIVKVLSGGSK